MKIVKVQNGLRGSKNPRRRKANGISKSRVSGWAKKNGLKLVSSQNPRRKKRRGRRRNGIGAPVVRTRNGLLGNTKSDAKQVGFIMAGAALTKGVGRIVAGFAAPYLSQMGLGRYTTIIADAVVALVAVPFVGTKTFGREAATFGRLGGLLAVGFDAFNIFAPDTLAAYNPFIDASPIVVANGRAAVAPEAVAQIAQEVANSPNPQAEAAKVAGVMNAASAGLGWSSGSAEEYIGQSLDLVT